MTQDVCYGADITPIEIVVVGANTFATVDPPADLPSGVNFDFVPDADTMGGVLTISGSPDAVINSPTTIHLQFLQEQLATQVYVQMILK